MYARQLTMQLKSDKRADFAKKIESEVLPLLRKQKGFKDTITFVNPEGRDAFAVSLWETKADADAYSQGRYADVAGVLAGLVEGSPRVRTFEVANSTLHDIAAKQKAA